MGVLVSEEDEREVEIEGETFKLKPLSFKADSEITNQGTVVNMQNTRQSQVDIAKMQLARLEKSIVDWSLSDDEGNKIPINSKNVGKLRTDVASELLDEVQDMSGMTAEEIKK